MPEAYTLPVTKALPLRQAKSWFVLEIRGARDIPGYNVDEVGRGMSPNNKRRECGGDWTASSGKVVYEEYGDIHEPTEPLPFDPALQLILGWDLPAATGGTPACAAMQVGHAGQLLVYGSILPSQDETVGVYDFGERVAEWLFSEFADPCGLTLADLNLVHYADPAGNAKPLIGASASSTRVELRSAYEVLRDGEIIMVGLDERGRAIRKVLPGRGWIMQPGEVSSLKRIEAVRARLTTNLRGGAPSIVLDVNATMLREAFRGGYAFKQRADGQYELDPAKNRHSHPIEALQYALSRLFTLRERKPRDEDSVTYRRQVRAPGRARM